MSQVCENCGVVAYRLRFMPTIKKSLGYGSGSCQCAEKHLGQRTAMPYSQGRILFEITFDHVDDEFGQ